eukprot:m.12456 g.12456  ORF g.12456 m.12456 type:complete len:275 (-) comp17458_c0_seq2:106-930(-)
MFRTQYDNDITVWSPQGRIHQIEYAMEAVKQGSAAVGVKNATHAVLVTLKRSPSALSAHQRKVFQVDKHVGIGIAGLTSDGRSLCSFMQSECLSHRWRYEEPLPISRLVSSVGLKMQVCTQKLGRRPFGVGLILIGHDTQGPHVYQLMPSAMTYDCKAMSIGARSQSARTYLEKNIEAINSSPDLDTLIHHALQALQDCLPNDVNLTVANCEVAVVGVEQSFSLLEDEAVQSHLQRLERQERVADDADQDADAPQEPADAAEPAAGAEMAVDVE